MTPRVRPDRDIALAFIEKNRRLASALKYYGRHLDWCGEWAEGNQPCECGLAAVIEEPSRTEHLEPESGRSGLHSPATPDDPAEGATE